MRVTDSARLVVTTSTLKTADYVLGDESGVVYSLDSHPRCGVVETKRAMNEVAQNLFDPHRRENFIGLLTRMRSAYSHPLLVLEGGLEHLAEGDEFVNPGLVMDALIRVLMQHKIQLATIPTSTPRQRRLCGEFVARWLINASLSPEPIHDHPVPFQPPSCV